MYWVGLFVLVAVNAFSILAINPGVRMRLTQNGIVYVNKVVQVVLKDLLQNLQIYDLSGEKDNLQYSLKNIHSTETLEVDSSIVLNPAESALDIRVKDFDIEISTDYDMTYKVLFFPVSSNGRLNVKVSGSSLNLTVGLDIDSDSRPKVSLKACNVVVGTIDLKFKDSNIMNLLSSLFHNTIKQKVIDMVCPYIDKQINGVIAEKIKNLPLTVSIADQFVLDFSFLKPLAVTSEYLQSSNKGEFFWKEDLVTECPFSPEPIQDNVDNSKMFYLWVSEYTPRTLAYVAHINNILQYTITKDGLSDSYKPYLDTTCDDKECIGSMIPQIGEKFPSSVVEILIKSTQVPDIKLRDKFSMTLFGSVELSARAAGGESETFITGQLTLSLSGKVFAINDSIKASIDEFSVKVDNVTSSIDQVTKDWINLIVNAGLNSIVLPQVKALAEDGIKIPVIRDVTFENPGIDFVDGAFLLSTDILYQDIE